MMMLAAIAILGFLSQQPSTPQQPQQIRGWHGAEWGMSVEEVKSAAGMRLVEGDSGKCLTSHGKGPVLRSDSLEVLGYQATPTFCFSDDGKLEHVTLSFEDGPSFERIRDELRGTYGPETSQSTGRLLYATWILPNTEIGCNGMVTVDGKQLGVVSYRMRKRSVL